MAADYIVTEKGYTDFASWLITLEEGYDTIREAASTPEGVSENLPEVYTASITLHHETIHFWHSISTRFLYNFSCDFINLCVDAVDIIGRKKIRYDDPRIVELQKGFIELLDRLSLSSTTESSESPIKAIDVIEACAVLCSFRIKRPRESHDIFRTRLDRDHSGPGQRQYRSAYLFAEEKVGKLAFDLFAPACYLALQYRNPGDTLVALLEHAKEGAQIVPHELIIEDPLTFLLHGTNMQESDCFPLRIRRGIPQGRSSHPVLAPYIKTIATSTHQRINDVFARPYIYFWNYFFNTDSQEEDAVETRELVSQLLPPLVFHADYSTSRRMYTATGLGRRLGENYLSLVFYLTALAGIIDRLLFGDRPIFSKHAKVLCPHQACSVHKTNLCRTNYTFPLDDFRKCEFPKLLKDLNIEGLIT